MSTTKTKNVAQLQSQMSAESLSKENSSEKQLIVREKIENSPFWVIGTEDSGYFVVLKHYRISETYETVEEARNAIHTEKWNIAFRMCAIIFEILSEEEQPQQKTSSL